VEGEHARHVRHDAHEDPGARRDADRVAAQRVERLEAKPGGGAAKWAREGQSVGRARGASREDEDAPRREEAVAASHDRHGLAVQVERVVGSGNVLDDDVDRLELLRRDDGEAAVVEVVAAHDLVQDRATGEQKMSRVSEGGSKRARRGARDALVGKVLAAGRNKDEVSSRARRHRDEEQETTHKVMLLRVHSKMALALPVATMPPAADELKKLIWSAWSGT